MNKEIEQLKERISKLEEISFKLPLSPSMVGALNQAFISSSFDKFKTKILLINTIGNVSSSGVAGSIFPVGWTVAKTGTGTYTITHNLGTLNYVSLAMPIDIQGLYCTMGKSQNTLLILVTDFASSPQDCAFNFIILT